MSGNHPRQPAPPLRLALALLGALIIVAGVSALWAGSAMAFHDGVTGITDDTARSLEHRDVRLGLWRAEYTPLPRLTLSTFTWPWLLRVPNGYLKYQLLRTNAFSAAAQVGLAAHRLGALENNSKGEDGEGDAPLLLMMPIGLLGTVSMGERVHLSGEAKYSRASLRHAGGTVQEELSLGGAVAVSNLQLASTLELWLGEVWAVLLHGRLLVHQDSSASADVTYRVDDYTTVHVFMSGRSATPLVEQGWQLVPSIAGSWTHFNLRAGLGYGNINLPGLNLLLPDKTLVPEFDLYWRW